MTVPTCPACGSSFTIDATAEKVLHVVPGYFIVGRSVIEERLTPCVVAFCNGCEFAIEIRKEDIR